jgi:hypothetical protein
LGKSCQPNLGAGRRCHVARHGSVDDDEHVTKGNFTDLKLDVVNGGISISDGRWNFSSPHISVAGATNFHAFYQTGGSVTVVSPKGNFASAATTTAICNIWGGGFGCVGGIIPTGGANCSVFVFEADCLFSIVGVGIEKTSNLAYTAPVINTRDTATGVIAANSMSAKGTGSGAFHIARAPERSKGLRRTRSTATRSHRRGRPTRQPFQRRAERSPPSRHRRITFFATVYVSSTM